MRDAFAGSPDERRAALSALLADGRLRVLADDERGWRSEGAGYLAFTVETTDARDQDGPGRLHSIVFGRSSRVSPETTLLSNPKLRIVAGDPLSQ